MIQKEQPTVPAVPQSGPTSSFDEFFLAEFPRMVAFATVLVGDRVVAEELAQEAMLRVFRNWATVSGYDRPGAWVRRVTANLASSTRRRRGIESRALERAERRATNFVTVADATDVDRSERFWALVRELPARQREAVALHYLEDWPVRKIADFLGCAESTARRTSRRLGAGSPRNWTRPSTETWRTHDHRRDRSGSALALLERTVDGLDLEARLKSIHAHAEGRRGPARPRSRKVAAAIAFALVAVIVGVVAAVASISGDSSSRPTSPVRVKNAVGYEATTGLPHGFRATEFQKVDQAPQSVTTSFRTVVFLEQPLVAGTMLPRILDHAESVQRGPRRPVAGQWVPVDRSALGTAVAVVDACSVRGAAGDGRRAGRRARTHRRVRQRTP